MSKSDLSPIEQTVQKHLHACFDDKKQPRLVIGVSGGADSMCLLHILHRLGAQLHIVHLNYQKRGTASDKDAELVKNIASSLGIYCKIIKVDADEARGQNFQQWAREVRYAAFEDEADQVQADGIAVAHHRDDQLETILQKIFRGGGLASWSAMEVWDGRLFRPLLEVPRAEIEAYCRRRDIQFRNDASNFSSDYARNFLRNDWIPQLKEYFPGWRANVLRVAEQSQVFASAIQCILKQIMDEQNQLNRTAFLKLDEDLQKSILLCYLKKKDVSASVSRHALGELSKLASLQTGQKLQLEENIKLLRDRQYFKIISDTLEENVDILIQRADLEQSAMEYLGLSIQLKPWENPDFETTIYMDAARLKWPLKLRKWRPGDRFQPLGMSGHQTVAEHLTNRKISANKKSRSLVMESFEETICAVIFPPIENKRPPGTVSEQTKCTVSTQCCLTIQRN